MLGSETLWEISRSHHRSSIENNIVYPHVRNRGSRLDCYTHLDDSVKHSHCNVSTDCLPSVHNQHSVPSLVFFRQCRDKGFWTSLSPVLKVPVFTCIVWMPPCPFIFLRYFFDVLRHPFLAPPFFCLLHTHSATISPFFFLAHMAWLSVVETRCKLQVFLSLHTFVCL